MVAMGRALEILELSQDMGSVTASQDRTVIVRKMISKVSLNITCCSHSNLFLCIYRVHTQQSTLVAMLISSIFGQTLLIQN